VAVMVLLAGVQWAVCVSLQPLGQAVSVVVVTAVMLCRAVLCCIVYSHGRSSEGSLTQ
jgi:hypothetical protein